MSSDRRFEQVCGDAACAFSLECGRAAMKDRAAADRPGCGSPSLPCPSGTLCVSPCSTTIWSKSAPISIGDELGQCRLQPLTVRRGTGIDGDRAARLDADRPRSRRGRSRRSPRSWRDQSDADEATLPAEFLLLLAPLVISRDLESLVREFFWRSRPYRSVLTGCSSCKGTSLAGCSSGAGPQRDPCRACGPRGPSSVRCSRPPRVDQRRGRHRLPSCWCSTPYVFDVHRLGMS
jgi:hypothetical protein